MSWQTRLSVTYTSAADLVENAVNGIHKVLTDAGWTTLHALNITSGQTDRVYYSTGESGTEAIYFRISQSVGTERIRFGLYTFWDSSGGGTGYNQVRGGGSIPEIPHMFSLKAAQTLGWIIANKNGLSIVVRQDVPTTYGTIYVGLLENRFIPTDRSGRTTLSSGITVAASGTTNLPVVSSSNIKTGQKIFVINQTAGANAGNLLRCTVTATAAGQITVTNDGTTATSFDTGALVGADPQPVLFLGHAQTYPYSSYYGGHPLRGATFLYGMSTLRMTGTAQAINDIYGYLIGMRRVAPMAAIADPGYGASEFSNQMGDPYIYGRMNPDIDGKYLIEPMMMIGGYGLSTGAITSDKCIRGTTERITCIPNGGLASEDIVSISSASWLFIDVRTTWGSGSSSFSWGVKITE